MKYVALLRGINVGGKHLLPMADLAGFFEDHGAVDVETYIQSGNVLFAASQATAERLPALVRTAIAGRFGFQAPIVLRAANELANVIAQNPFHDADPGALHVAFLDAPPTPEAIASLDPNRSPPDTFAVVGREIYLSLPNGVSRSKLTNDWFDRKLATTSTLRNWKTVLELTRRAHH